MAKPRYKIPISLNRSTLDHEITIEAKSMKLKPLPVKVLTYWFLAFVVIAWVLVKSPLSAASLAALIPLGIWLVAVAVVMGRRTKTGEFTFMQMPALLAYLPPQARKVMTRSNSRPYGFMSVVGIKNVSRDGIIAFDNGDLGQMYAVVGSASRLLFDSDREAIMRRADAFYRKIDSSCTWIQITTKEPQRVFQQMAAVEMTNLKLSPANRDPGLDVLLQERLDVLDTEVAGQFESLHQYLLVRGKSLKDLRNAHKVLVGERQSVLFLRRCEVLKGAQALEVLAPIYRSEHRERVAV